MKYNNKYIVARKQINNFALYWKYMEDKGTGLNIVAKVVKDLIKETKKPKEYASHLIRISDLCRAGQLLGQQKVTTSKYNETASLINLVLGMQLQGANSDNLERS